MSRGDTAGTAGLTEACATDPAGGIAGADLRIRDAREDDLAAIYRIEELSFVHPWSEESLLRQITDKTERITLVACLPCGDEAAPEARTADSRVSEDMDGSGVGNAAAEDIERKETVTGYAGLWIVAGEGQVTNVAVLPEWRGKQIGTRLVGELLRRAAEGGAGDVTLEVRAGNEAALRVYRKAGFVEEGRRKGYYRDNKEDALILWKREGSHDSAMDPRGRREAAAADGRTEERKDEGYRESGENGESEER